MNRPVTQTLSQGEVGTGTIPCSDSFDGKCFIYTDGASKFIIHPNYQMKVSREVVKLVNFITATRRTDKKEFNGRVAFDVEHSSMQG